MKWFFIVFLSCYLTFAFAEHTEQRNQVYNAQSQLTVDNIINSSISSRSTNSPSQKEESRDEGKSKTETFGTINNQVVDVLRNPTVMSGNFRQALKNISPGISTATASISNNNEENDMPFIELVAKVVTPDKIATVVLRVNDHTLHLTEGSTASQMVNRKIVNIRVDKITENNVTIFLSPFDQVMVLQ